MIVNNKRGVRNVCSTVNYAKQTANMYMNEQSAPIFAGQLYQNSRQMKWSENV